MNQNLSSYWIFYTVAGAGNISKAAKELYISQPAISKSIQKLEENLGQTKDSFCTDTSERPLTL